MTLYTFHQTQSRRMLNIGRYLYIYTYIKSPTANQPINDNISSAIAWLAQRRSINITYSHICDAQTRILRPTHIRIYTHICATTTPQTTTEDSLAFYAAKYIIAHTHTCITCVAFSCVCVCVSSLHFVSIEAPPRAAIIWRECCTSRARGTGFHTSRVACVSVCGSEWCRRNKKSNHLLWFLAAL